ncbi:glycoside hydrolase family 27 protein [Ramaria rubella]|nr:glycoside hydrolase family 27 protein [Ramaria rubella]
MLSRLLIAGAVPLFVQALNNGVAKLPVMGYNAWNVYQCNLDEALALQTAGLMKSLGLIDLGYKHYNLDDCWAAKNRTSKGLLAPDPLKFPTGFNNFTTELHRLGLNAGIYSDSGWFTCAGYPGSFEHEESDVEQFTGWGFDYLKYDNCAIPYDDIIRQGIVGKYQRMADAIAAVQKSKGGQPMIFSLCEWGWSQVWLWGSQLGHSWRIDGDIAPNWDSLATIIDSTSFITSAGDFYGHNDMDMLQLGNGGLTFEESKSHFTAWALLKSPLLIGTNLSAITPEILSILKNDEIIAINQDPVVGTSISPFRWGINPDFVSNSSFPAQYWSGQSENGTVFMLLNTLNETAEMFFNLTESPWIRAGRQYSVRDLWSHTDNGTAVRNFTTTLPPHGVSALLLKDAGDEPAGLFPACAVWFQCTDQNGTHVGG